MRERASLGVLAGEPDRNALGEQARERQRLALAPVDPTRAKRLAPPLELLESFGVRLEALGQREQLLVQRLEPLRRDGGQDGAARVGRDLASPASRAARRSRRFRRSCAARSSFCVSSTSALGLLRGQDALLDEPRCVELAGGRLRRDLRRPSAAGCTRPRPARCARSAGSRRGRRRCRARTAAGTRARAGPRRSPPRGRSR